MKPLHGLGWAVTRPGWRIGALFFVSTLVFFVALGGPAGSGAAQPAFGYVGGGSLDLNGARHPMAPVRSQPLGTEDDCNSRLGASAKEYCSDLFLGLEDLDTFWQDAFKDVAK